MNRRMRIALAALAAVSVVAPPPVGANDVLAEVRQLYAEAFYERALTVLDHVSTQETLTPADEQSIRRYKALCLIALDRTEDAVRVVDEIVRENPAARPDSVDPPRLRKLISDARGRVLPDLVRERYARGRAHFERKAFAEASADFESVVALLDDTSVGLRATPGLADLGLLARGFLDLLRTADRRLAAVPPLPATQATPIPAGPQNLPIDVMAPVAIHQKLPQWPNALRNWLTEPREGAVEVLVGVDGLVQSATMVTPIHLMYDRLLLTAAKRWKYRPALRNGVPIPYTKLVRVVITANSS